MRALTLEEIAIAVGGNILMGDGAKPVPALDVCTDTRKIKAGDLFVPIVGENFDGHSFIAQAFENGAVCCLSANDVDMHKGNIIIRVEDTRQALKDLAEYYISLFDIPVIGITGSVGKTSTKDMIASVISRRYNVLKTEGNLNNEIGLPITAFKLTSEHEAVVLEMGMSGFGEIHSLAKVARPNIAVITNIGVSHIENLGSRSGILTAKSEIFDYFVNSDKAVLNADDDMLLNIDAKLKNDIIWYGIKSRRGIYAANLISRGLAGTSFALITDKGGIDIDVKAPGEHVVSNALAAAAVGLELGISLEDIKAGIEAFVPTGMRMSISKGENGCTLINDAYNANPVSMKSALDVLAEAEGPKVAVLGDMLELGVIAEEMHKSIGAYAANLGIDTIICIGELGKYIAEGARTAGSENVRFFDTQDGFLAEGLSLITPDCSVLLKASRGMHFEKTAKAIQGEVK